METSFIHTCAPHRVDMARSTGSCLTYSELVQIASVYNSKHSEAPIPRKLFKTKRKLHDALSKRFDDRCRGIGEHCWARPHLAGDEAFRPPMPESWEKDERQWLDTYDIMVVMKQYEKLHKDFRFVGVFPKDFARQTNGKKCISTEMCDKDMYKGRKKLGFVFNHDDHDQSGSHWVALFIDGDRAMYFDSQGVRPKKEVVDFLEQRMSVRWTHNKVQLQFKNTECGMFSMMFLITCLESKPGTAMRAIVEKIGNDDDVFEMRKRLFVKQEGVA